MGGQESKSEPILVTNNNLQKDSPVQSNDSNSVSMIIAVIALVLITSALFGVCLIVLCKYIKKKLIENVEHSINIQHF